MRIRLFPGINDLRAFRHPLEHFRIAEVVVNDDFGPFDQLLGAQGHESEITGARADQIASACLFLFSHRVVPSISMRLLPDRRTDPPWSRHAAPLSTLRRLVPADAIVPLPTSLGRRRANRNR